jgi:acetyl esterase/lipase
MSSKIVISLMIFSGLLVIAQPSFAAAQPEIRLWEGVAPGSEGADIVKETVEERGSAEHPDRKIRGVTTPTITLYRPDSETNTGTAILIIPGGGYSAVVIDKTGHDYARYLNSIGITGIVLKYRLPRPEGFVFDHEVPLRDAARAMRMVRYHAKDWGLNPENIGVMGSSAGGHLASTLATHFASIDASTSGEVTDPVDSLSSRPDFQVLVYPVISFNAEVAHSGSRKNLIGENPTENLVELYSNELQVTANSPPAFLVSTSDDHVKAENSLLYFQALRAVNVPAELHIYEIGGHGYGITPTGKPVATWHHRMKDWMKQRGLLDK